MTHAATASSVHEHRLEWRRWRGWKDEALPAIGLAAVLCGPLCLVGLVFLPGRGTGWAVGAPALAAAAVSTLRLVHRWHVHTSCWVEGEMLHVRSAPWGWTWRLPLLGVDAFETRAVRSRRRTRTELWALRQDGREARVPLPADSPWGEVRTMLEEWRRCERGCRSRVPDGFIYPDRRFRPPDDGRPSWLLTLGLTLFVLPHLVLGVALVGVGIWFLGLREMWHARWPQAQATVVAHDAQQDAAGGWEATLTVEYPWQGQVLRQPLRGDRSNDHADATALLRSHPLGGVLALRLPPATGAPPEIPGIRWGRGLMISGAGLFFVMIAGTLIGVFWNARLPERRRLRLPKMIGAILGGGFLLLFPAAGTLILWLCLIGPALMWCRTRSWVPTPCTIEQATVRPGGKSTHWPDILYRYEWQGRTYRSNRADLEVGSASGSGAADLVARHPVGGADTCFVNPADPGQAVLERRFFFRGGWVGCVVGGVFCAFGYGVPGMIAWGAWRGWRRRRAKR